MPKERGYILNADAYPQDDTYIAFDLMYAETADAQTSDVSLSGSVLAGERDEGWKV
jgi:hypothetical protein